MSPHYVVFNLDMRAGQALGTRQLQRQTSGVLKVNISLVSLWHCMAINFPKRCKLQGPISQRDDNAASMIIAHATRIWQKNALAFCVSNVCAIWKRKELWGQEFGSRWKAWKAFRAFLGSSRRREEAPTLEGFSSFLYSSTRREFNVIFAAMQYIKSFSILAEGSLAQLAQRTMARCSSGNIGSQH